MVMIINLCLKLAGTVRIFIENLLFPAALVFIIPTVFIIPAPAFAQNPAAMPVPAVEEEVIAEPGDGSVVIELFSSQACVFCPKADRLFADLLAQENVIGLACHVDYFDVREGSLSHPFCTNRQSWYMDKLAAGPGYTPQMVVNGVMDVVGYKLDAVTAAIRQASYAHVPSIRIVKNEKKPGYRASIPVESLQNPKEMKNLKLWIMVYDKPHNLTIAGGANKGKTATYYNIIDHMDSIDTPTAEMLLSPSLEARHAGFAVLLQNETNGKILAAGHYAIPLNRPQQPAPEKE